MNSNKLIKSIKALFISTKTISNDVICYKFRLLHKYLIFIFMLTFITISQSSFALDIDINDETLCKNYNDTNCIVYYGGHASSYTSEYVNGSVRVCDKYVLEVNSINDINIKCKQTSLITRESSYFRDLVNSLNDLETKTESTTPTITSNGECSTSFSETKGNTEIKSSSTSFSDYKSRDKIDFEISYQYKKNGVSNSCSAGSCEYWKNQQMVEPKKEDFKTTCPSRRSNENEEDSDTPPPDFDDLDFCFSELTSDPETCYDECRYSNALESYNTAKNNADYYCKLEQENGFTITEIKDRCKDAGDATGYRCWDDGKTLCVDKISYGDYKVVTGVSCLGSKYYVKPDQRFCYHVVGSYESYCIYDEYKCCTRIATYKARVIKDYYSYKIKVYKPNLYFNEKALIEIYDPNLLIN